MNCYMPKNECERSINIRESLKRLCIALSDEHKQFYRKMMNVTNRYIDDDTPFRYPKIANPVDYFKFHYWLLPLVRWMNRTCYSRFFPYNFSEIPDETFTPLSVENMRKILKAANREKIQAFLKRNLDKYDTLIDEKCRQHEIWGTMNDQRVIDKKKRQHKNNCVNDNNFQF